MKNIRILFIALLITGSNISCKKYLDIVPDNIPTIDYAFRMRNTAERYLFTCYSFMPELSNVSNSPALFSGDDLWLPIYPFTEFNTGAWEIALGNQNKNAPHLDYWNGGYMNKNMWRGIRECNIFLENIEKVPDMQEYEKEQWIAEAKFLKAYYHFFMLQLYGPIPIMKDNVSITASSDDVRVTRRPVDEVFKYIVELLDESMEHLPLTVIDENSELGRITLPIAIGMKAKILVYAASPLFNGNSDYNGFTNKDGTVLFDQVDRKEKWELAAAACKEAIDKCRELGYDLYTFEETNQARNLSLQTKLTMNIRGTTNERWNKEIIWANTNFGSTSIQQHATPRGLDPAAIINAGTKGNLSVPMRIASLFYSKNGVPIEEDDSWGYNNRFQLRTATATDKFYIRDGYVTARFNFDREARFYATLGFDGGTWYGQGKFVDTDMWYVQAKAGERNGLKLTTNYAITGYYPKKYVNYTNVASTVTNTTYTILEYPWVMLRLGDLYLLYAEAMNEAYGPGPEVYKYLNLIRERAGLLGVQDSWSRFSSKPDKYLGQEGLSDIIRQERSVEMALEGQRFFDLRRWKTANDELNRPITGWDATQSTAAAYYRERVIYRRSFSLKDYFWPINEKDLIVNKNLVQNPGW
jgi:hypothetical protein